MVMWPFNLAFQKYPEKYSVEFHPEDEANKENNQVASPFMHKGPMFITKYNNRHWAIKKTLVKNTGRSYVM